MSEKNTSPDSKLSDGETEKVFGLLREIATDKSKIKQLNKVKSRLDKSIKDIKSRISANEITIFEPYEQDTPEPTTDTLKQLEIIFE